jgi:hypothetical protein
LRNDLIQVAQAVQTLHHSNEHMRTTLDHFRTTQAATIAPTNTTVTTPTTAVPTATVPTGHVPMSGIIQRTGPDLSHDTPIMNTAEPPHHGVAADRRQEDRPGRVGPTPRNLIGEMHAADRTRGDVTLPGNKRMRMGAPSPEITLAPRNLFPDAAFVVGANLPSRPKKHGLRHSHRVPQGHFAGMQREPRGRRGR